MKSVVLGITSGIAAYKTLDLVRELKKDGVSVFVVMTDAAKKMVDSNDFEKESGNKVFSELFEEGFDYKDILRLRKVDHIDLADKADVICIAPATANTIAKLAHGIADDFLTTMVLAANSPIVLAPSMNVHMWSNPVTKQNVEILRKRGFIIIPPEHGPLACGYDGPGRLPHILKIKDEIEKQILNSKSLTGKTIVVTAGGTKEYIDDVRFITNNSTGKMGIALADEAYLRGANVILLRAKNSVTPRYLYQTEEFETGEDLEKLMVYHIKNANIVIHAAAIGDFTSKRLEGKISSEHPLDMYMSPRKKLRDEIKKINENIYLILFKAEYDLADEQLTQKAREIMKESDADMVIANDISRNDRGFASDSNEVLLVTKEDDIKIPLTSKEEIAKEILSAIHLPKNS